MRRIRLLVVDDHSVLADSLGEVVGMQDDMLLVGTAPDGREAVDMARDRKPDVVVMDLAMKHLDGMRATREILCRDPAVKIVVLSVHSDDFTVSQMFKLGAAAYLVKEERLPVVVEAIRKAFKGEKFISEKIRARRRSGLSAVQPERRMSLVPPGALTARQLDVLRLFSMGSTNTEIAAALKVSYSTVRSHRHLLEKKLGIGNRADAIRYATFHGLIPQ